MAELFAGGRIVDLILILVVLEGITLLAYRRRTGHGIGGRGLLSNLLAGVCLLLALRVALTGGGWPLIALCLAASGLAHAVDLWLRWQPPIALPHRRPR